MDSNTVESRVAELQALVGALTKERDLMADEVQVKTQMCVSLANVYSSARAALDSAKAASSDKDSQLMSNVNEVSTLRQQIQQATARAGTAERRCRELESELAAARHATADADKRSESALALERDLKKALQDNEEMHRTMDDWKSKVKDALKENRKKEAAYAQADIEQKRQISKLQEALDKSNFELEAHRLRDTRVRKVETETQTDRPPTPPAPVHHAPSTPLLGSTARELTTYGGGSGFGGHSLPPRPMSPLAPPLPYSETAFRSPTPEQMHPDAAPFMSPPPIKPPEEQQPPMIVTVHYGSSDGWTVDTKTLVKCGDTVGTVIADVCERVNSRYGRNLDCASMCMKTHHAKAKRFVVLSEHREMHSFAYFKKCFQEGKPINLNLEPLPEGQTTFASPTGRGHSRAMSASMSRARVNF